MAKKNISTTINSVTVEFATGANNKVEQSLLNLLRAVIKTNVCSEKTLLSKIYITATTNGKHSKKSRHFSGKAVDISRINGMRMSVHYPSDNTVKCIVDALQEAAEKQTGIRENFGPHVKKKQGANWSVGGHKDHIHFSVN